ncbi:tetratricopeptide repeat protein [Pedosphaera parvula]|uniref:General secretory system II protein E domain protein n=1 Tax=Pedosphaera parvula (strain Ellin514) TaxID=320771 RepID=B9XRT4_PEDPL|nr:general secretion pathway protein GspE [Pedosphaera parvula]EEF57445.1 General secretory system II protein E domain protein [Pedosphaera parvula Ellin514]
MSATLTTSEEAQLAQTIEMFEVITQSQSQDYQSLEILKEAYLKLGREKDVINTSKRIAQAYVQLGQLSSAILEYETVLQRYPGDPDVQAALKEIEIKANNFTAPPALSDSVIIDTAPDPAARFKKGVGGKVVPVDFDDGRQSMQKIFVEGRLISAGDFDLCWSTPDLSVPPIGVSEPFIQLLGDKGIMPSEKSLRILVERSRHAYVPIEKYDLDMELARKFPAEICRRWCILPFDKMSKTIFVATANPFNRQAAKDLAEATQNRLLWYLAPPAEIVKYLRKVFR